MPCFGRYCIEWWWIRHRTCLQAWIVSMQSFIRLRKWSHGWHRNTLFSGSDHRFTETVKHWHSALKGCVMKRQSQNLVQFTVLKTHRATFLAISWGHYFVSHLLHAMSSLNADKICKKCWKYFKRVKWMRDVMLLIRLVTVWESLQLATCTKVTWQ